MQLLLKDKKVAEQKEIINSIRERYKSAPVTTSTSIKYQHTPADALVMQRAIKNFDTNTGMKGQNGEQLWKDYDNNVQELSKADFTALVDELDKLKDDLYSRVFEYAEGAKLMLPLQDDHEIFTDAHWANLFGDIE